MAQIFPIADAWRSTRLIFRSMEADDEDKAHFSYIQEGEPFAMAMTSPRLLIPGTKTSGDFQLNFLKEAYLRIFICLRDEEIPEGDSKKKARPTPIGTLFLWPTQGQTLAHHRNVMLGITLAPGYRGKGYGGEAINWALDWAFLRGGIHRVALGVYEFNTPAIKLYRKLGFVEEGRARQSLLFERKWCDTINMSMLEHEWEKLRGLVN